MDLQQRMSHHPNIVHYMGACCEYTDRELPGSRPEQVQRPQEQQRQQVSASTRRPMLAIVMEFCKLGNVFRMVQKVGGSCTYR